MECKIYMEFHCTSIIGCIKSCMKIPANIIIISFNNCLLTFKSLISRI